MARLTKLKWHSQESPYFPDIHVFLTLIPLISAFNYYLTYSNIRFNWFLILTFLIDTVTSGLGLDYAIIREQPAYGHSGGGIGAGCELYFFPERDIYIFVGINLGTVTESPIHEKALEARNKLYDVLLE